MDAISKRLEGKIDFRGQRLSDRIQQESLVFAAVAAFIVGWLLQSLALTLYIYTFFFVVTMIICIPPWPMYNRHDTMWLSDGPKGNEKKTQ
ncbi:microsomal signal peptidase 12 kDa subunit [Tilletiaria anomala UBC 951]|uniref:Signal peptidase complex subunit 1 n=1 Tax=Tilletiaria anomala (strain ATCC 24038 / CBS 436.72 / UBC 951) TaxID=1037660 RepID=A0A066V4R1_TILAU|nr:microsomal signal peptidase 12 kDa subunit [Tilletiaria anomala UBC 951]KDN36421.1 microsomal signal peptidase 12 kDa subunit [Tilletiaria anomala UBC 951]